MNKLERRKISGNQLAGILILIRLVPYSIHYPLVNITEVSQDTWIGALLSTILSIPLILLMLHLGLKFPNKTIIEYSQLLLGRWLGKLIGVILIWYWISIAAVTARALGEAYTTVFMPETPILAFIVIITFLACNAARKGIELLGRMSELILPVVTATGLFVIILPYSEMKFRNLLPFLSHGFKPIIKTTGVGIAFFVEFIVLGMILPYLNKPKDAPRFSTYAVLFSGLLMTIFTVSLVAIFGPTTSTLFFPSFSLSRMISIGQFLERIEVLPVGAWTLTSGIAVGMLIWASALGLSQILSASQFRPLVYPLGATTVAFGILFFENLIDFLQFHRKAWTAYSIGVSLGVMIILYVADFLRTRFSLGQGR